MHTPNLSRYTWLNQHNHEHSFSSLLPRYKAKLRDAYCCTQELVKLSLHQGIVVQAASLHPPSMTTASLPVPVTAIHLVTPSHRPRYTTLTQSSTLLHPICLKQVTKDTWLYMFCSVHTLATLPKQTSNLLLYSTLSQKKE